MAVEFDVRHQIDRALEAKGWILDATDPDRNVFLGNSSRKGSRQGANDAWGNWNLIIHF